MSLCFAFYAAEAFCLRGRSTKEVCTLPISRDAKSVLIDSYVARLQKSQAVIVSEYRGLSVKQLQNLRRELRSSSSELIIAKNSLMKRALQQVGLAAPQSLMKGPTAVVLCYKDLAGPAKSVTKFAKDSKVLVVKGGMIGQSVFDEAGVHQLSEMPGREQLLGQVVGVLQAPLSGLVNVLAGTVRGLVNVLNARSKQLDEAG
jgi:large subunit ribosomal protein L10